MSMRTRIKSSGVLAGLILGIVILAGFGAIAPDRAGQVDSGAVAVTDAGSYVEVCRIQAEGRPVLIRGVVGAGGAIAHLKIAQSVVQAGDVNDVAEDAGLATATVTIPYILGSTIHETAANGSFQMKLASGAADYVVYAKKATDNTTVRIVGRVQ
jgi:hypothetical protein